MKSKTGKVEYTEENVKQHLADSSKALADLTANMVYDEPSLLNPLIEVAWLDQEPISQRASRVVSICCCRFPELLKPYVSSIVENLKELKSEGPIRNFLKIFAEVPVKLTNRNKSILLNLCFDYLSKACAVSLKVYSMEILFKLSEDIPEIRRELYHLIEEQVPESSAGFKSRGNKILKKLSKRTIH